MEKDQNDPLIFGQPFLATGRALMTWKKENSFFEYKMSKLLKVFKAIHHN